MAKSGFDVDFDGSFKRALKKVAEKHRMTSAQIVNQTLLDIAEEGFNLAPMADKAHIASTLKRQVGEKVGRVIKSGPNAGKFKARTSMRQLMAVHLISNKGRIGKGLYGQSMRAYAAKVLTSRIGGVGSIKIGFLPAIRALMPFARFKFSWAKKAKGIKRWPGSSGWGSATPAKPAIKPEASFIIHRMPKRSSQDSKIQAIYNRVVAMAIWKRGNVIKKAEQIMKPDIDQFNR